MRSPSAPDIRHDLVLVGGGHAHIQVLKRWAMAPVPGARLTLVVDRPVAVYSGMVPGFVAGPVPARRPRDRRAAAGAARGSALHRRPGHRARHGVRGASSWTAGRRSPTTPCPSTWARRWRGSGCRGVREHAIPTRPIGEFVRRVDEVLAAARERDAARIVVVGAGAGGVEVAFALAARLRGERAGRGDGAPARVGPARAAGLRGERGGPRRGRGRGARHRDPLRARA